MSGSEYAGRYWKRAAWQSVPVLAIELMLVFALFAGTGFGMFPFMPPITLWEAVSKAAGTPTIDVIKETGAITLWVPALLLVWLASLAILRRVCRRWIAGLIGVCRAFLPLLPVCWAVPAAIAAAPVVTWRVFTGDMDGEMYDDLEPVIAALGWWLIYTIALIPFDVMRIPHAARSGNWCARCGYNTSGVLLAVCPECGAAR